jgi:alcohol dehydrogenase
MKPFSVDFSTKPPIKFGEGAASETGRILKEAGCTNVMIVTDDTLVKLGVADVVVNSIRDAGLSSIVFDQVLPDPTVDIIHAGSKIANENKVDGIVAVGGGSSMDSAKSISLLTTNPAPISDYYVWLKKPTKKRANFLILIPTTAGTGAEISSVAMIADRNGKNPVVDDNLRASIAIQDPLLMLGLPPYITATTAIDAMSHNIDGMTAGNCSVYSDMINGKAMEMIWDALPKVLKNPKDVESRGALAVAAGMPFLLDNVSWTHSTAHVFGAVYHLPHGHCCAMGLPFYLELLTPAKPHECKVLAKSIGLDPESPTLAQDFKAAFIKLYKDCGLKTPKELGWDKDEFIALTPKVMADPTYMMNAGQPGLPDETGVTKMLTEMWDF